MYRELCEVSTGFGSYLKDKWNVLEDSMGLLCLLVGLIIRWYDWASPWGPAFYALSAPLVVSRVLFYAQILPYQGPMIQASAQDIVLPDARSREARSLLFQIHSSTGDVCKRILSATLAYIISANQDARCDILSAPG